MSVIAQTAAGASNLGEGNTNISTYTLVIPQGQYFTQVSTCTSTNNAIVLPTLTSGQVGQIYTIRNDGVYTLGVCPNGVGSQINALPVLVNADAQLSCFYVGANASCDFYCISVAGSVVTWYANNYSGAKPTFFITAAITVPTGITQGIFMVSAAAAYTLTLPPAANSMGANYRVFMDIAGGNVVKVGGTGIAKVYGGGIGAVTTPIACQGVSTYNFAAAAIIGDWQDWTCDGTKWYVKAMGHVTVAFSTTA